MTRERTGVALVALTAGIAVAFVVARDSAESTLEGILGVAIGWSFVASGLVSWARRPENPIGRALVLAGLLRLGAEFCNGSSQAILFALGHVLHAAFWIAVAYVLLAFPTGRLESVLSRWILLGAGIFVPLRVVWIFVGGDERTGDALALTDSSQAARAIERAEAALSMVLVSLIIIVLARRWLHASPRLRVSLAPVLWAGAAGFGGFLLSVVDDAVGDPLGVIPMVLVDLVLAGVAVGFLIGVLRVRLARSAVAELVIELGEAAAPGDVRNALARALRDRSVALAYWLPDGERYVDIDGRPFELPPETGSRAVSLVERDGRRIAALVHDPALDDEPELVQSVCATAALALENERLQAELRAHVEDLRESRIRIVEAADVERRRIERNLHDGAQQRLVWIAMTLGLAESKLHSDPVAADAIVREARDGLSAALAELRELSQGIHPAILTERGLDVALRDLSLHAAVPVDLSVTGERLPERVEAAAYYVVCEALANVAKYADATSARVRVDRSNGKAVVEVADDGIGGADVGRGSGLRGLTDRVEALGGTLSLSSPRGKGTIVRAELPCA